MKEVISALDTKYNTRVPVGSLIQQGVPNIFKASGTFANGGTGTITLAKTDGDLVVASNLITLPKGFVYEMDYTLNIYNSTAGAASLMDAKIVKSADNSEQGTVAKAGMRTINGSGEYGEAGVGTCLIDLTSASSDLVVKYYVSSTIVGSGNVVISNHSFLKIKKYLKAS